MCRGTSLKRQCPSPFKILYFSYENLDIFTRSSNFFVLTFYFLFIILYFTFPLNALKEFLFNIRGININ